MLTESNFPVDIRVSQEADLLTVYGHKIIVIAIQETGQSLKETINKIKVYRIPKINIFKLRYKPKISNLSFITKLFNLLIPLINYGFGYIYFTVMCLFLSIILLVKNKFDVIHTHNPPDTLFAVALFHKILFGKKFIYDHHDLSPDLFLEKFDSKSIFIHRLLLLLEKLSCRSADLIIATNESYKRIEIERCGVKPQNIYIVRNGPDLNKIKITDPIKCITKNGKFILCYLGVINIQDGVEYLIHTLEKIINRYNYNNILLLIIGDGDHLESIKELANKLMISDYIIFTNFVKDKNELNKYLSSADIFLDAAPNSFLNNNSTFIKLMEYMVFEKTIITFSLKESVLTLKDAGLFVPPNDTDEMAKTIITVINNNEIRAKLGQNARKRVKELSWEKVSRPLVDAYNSILSPQKN